MTLTLPQRMKVVILIYFWQCWYNYTSFFPNQGCSIMYVQISYAILWWYSLNWENYKNLKKGVSTQTAQNVLGIWCAQSLAVKGLKTLCLLAGQVRVTAGNSDFCCCLYEAFPALINTFVCHPPQALWASFCLRLEGVTVQAAPPLWMVTAQCSTVKPHLTGVWWGSHQCTLWDCAVCKRRFHLLHLSPLGLARWSQLKDGLQYSWFNTACKVRYCTQGQILHARSDTACKVRYCTQGSILHARSDTACKVRYCMQGWILHARSDIACKVRYCTQGWILHTRLDTARKVRYCTHGSILHARLDTACQVRYRTQGWILHTSCAVCDCDISLPLT